MWMTVETAMDRRNLDNEEFWFRCVKKMKNKVKRKWKEKKEKNVRFDVG